MKIRPSSLAGRWYDDNPIKLKSSIQSYLDASPAQKLLDLHAVIVPHAGHYWSGPTAAAAFNAIKPDQFKRIFILCPNHRVPVRGNVSVSADAFETPLGQIPVDQKTVQKFLNYGILNIDDGAHKLEHAIEIQLPFIQVIFEQNLPLLVPIIVGENSTDNIRAFAQVLAQEMTDEDLLIISSDFLHYGENYGYVPFGSPVFEQIKEYDARTVAAISELNSSSFEQFAKNTPHAACGINSLRVLAAAFENLGFTAQQLAYDTSGQRSGDDSMSVSYVAMAVTGKWNHQMNNDTKNPVSETAQKTAHQIVLRSLNEAVLRQKNTQIPNDLDLGSDPDVFNQEYGVFVTLNDAHGNLRGCIGNIIPVASLRESLWNRAQDAALNDPRFEPVQPDELPNLHIEISVLTPMKHIEGPEQIVIGKHGVVLRKAGRSAVFLPQVAPEQGWNVEQMLTALSRKAGLAPQAWREGAQFSVFEAQVF